MDRMQIIVNLEYLREARQRWADARRDFDAGCSALMARMILEAAIAKMSAEQVANYSGYTAKQVRQMFRDKGLNPKHGVRLLSKQAAETLGENAALLGIEPHEIDLMSPLAYLPMGQEMRTRLRVQREQEQHEQRDTGVEVYVLTSSDNPEGDIYRGVFASFDAAQQHCWQDLQNGAGGVAPKWSKTSDGCWFSRNEQAPHGAREFTIRKVEVQG